MIDPADTLYKCIANSRCKMLEHFWVNNYKSLVDVGLPLTPLHVVIGQNDSGKTSLLEAILALSRSMSLPLTEAFAGEWKGRELVNEGATRPIVEFYAILSDDGMSGSPGGEKIHYKCEIDFHSNPQQRVCSLRRESVKHDQIITFPNDNIGQTRLSLRSNPSYTHGMTFNDLALLDRLVQQMSPASLYRFDPKAMSTPAAMDPGRKFRMDPDGFGLATLLDDILGYEAERFIQLKEEFCAYFPQFRRVRIETDTALTRQLTPSGTLSSSGQGIGKGIFFETVGGASIRAQQASDGALLFLGLLALIHSPNPPKLLLIEEPEKGIYPRRLEEFIAILRRLEATPSAGNVPQIIMTTHSPYLLSFFKPEEVTVLSRRGGTGPVRARPLRDAPHILDRLGNEFYLGELWYNLSEEELFGDA